MSKAAPVTTARVDGWPRLRVFNASPCRNYSFGKYGFVVLSLAAKSALAWQAYSGTQT